jgi:2-polyprenyl-6-methoxyphenol hydroxylase-like FAD-dependent oxidoreductase
MNAHSTPRTGARPDVVVVGGGIGGLSAALALTLKGLRVRVLERSSAFGEVGAGLQIAPNCTRILDRYGLLDEAKRLGVVPDGMVMRDGVDATGVTDQTVVGYENTEHGAKAVFADGHVEEAEVVIAADGLHSVARRLLVDDEPVSSSYVAYRGAMPIEQVRAHDVSETDVVVYVGPRCHFVQYPLRGGEMFNQVAVFESPKAVAGEDDWGTPDELDAAFEQTCEQVRQGLPLMWRDRWWRMYDRDPLMSWVHGRIALLGDAAHPPLQYMAQGAVMAIEDGWVLAEHVARQRPGRTAEASGVDWDAALAAYEAVRPEHCRRVLTTARSWGELWHLDGVARLQRNALLRARDTYDYTFTDWIYGPTALFPEEEPELYPTVPLASAPVGDSPVPVG